MRRRLYPSSLAVLGLATGCLAQQALPEPATPDGTQTIVIEVREPGGRTQLWASDAREPWRPPVTALQDDLDFVLYAYPESAEELQIPLGVMLEARGLRRLPVAPWTAFSAGIPTQGWSRDAAPRGSPTRRWLPEFDWTTCLAAGGCAAPPLLAGSPDRCDLTCAATAVTAPRAPDAPRGPGWVPQAELGPFSETIHTPAHPTAARCANGQVHFWGKSTCEDLSSCDAPWPPAPGGPGAVIYVSAEPGPPGDGSMQAPLRTLARAAQLSGSGDAILLSAGVHEVGAGLSIDGRRVHGVCAARTTIRQSAEDSPWSIDAADARIEAVTLPSLRVTGQNLVLHAVAWSSPTKGALSLVGTSSASVVRAHVRAGVGPLFEVSNGALRLEQTVIEGWQGEAVRCAGAGSVDLEAVAFRAGDAGVALSATRCQIDGRDLLFEGGTGSGLWLGDSSQAILHGVIVRDLGADGGFGLVAADAAQVALTDALFDRLGGTSISVHESGAVLASDLVIRDQASDREQALIIVGTHADFEVRRAYLRAPGTSALTCTSLARSTVFEDVIIDNRTEGPVPRHGLKLRGGSARLARVAIALSDARGIETNTRSWTRVELEDVRLRGGEIGANIEPSVDLEMSRVAFESVRQFGLQIGDQTGGEGEPEAEVNDLSIRGCEAGPGLHLRGRSSASVWRFELLDNSGTGAQVTGDARLRLERGLIRGHDVGVEWRGGARSTPGDVLVGVRFEDNRTVMRQAD